MDRLGNFLVHVQSDLQLEQRLFIECVDMGDALMLKLSHPRVKSPSKQHPQQMLRKEAGQEAAEN